MASTGSKRLLIEGSRNVKVRLSGKLELTMNAEAATNQSGPQTDGGIRSSGVAPGVSEEARHAGDEWCPGKPIGVHLVALPRERR